MAQSAISDGTQLDQVHRATQEGLQRLLQIEKIRKAVGRIRLELDHDVYVTAGGIEVATNDRAEDLQLLHAVAEAQRGYGFTVISN